MKFPQEKAHRSEIISTRRWTTRFGKNMFFRRILVKTFAFDSFCVNCRSSQSLEPRWVGIGTNPIVGFPALEFWSVALCASCRRNKILSAFQEKAKPLWGALGTCGLGLLICWLGWGMQPQQPSPGYRWTAPAQLFHGLIPMMPYVFGLAAVLGAPVLLWWLAKILHARKAFRASGKVSSEVLDDIYAGSARERLRAACAETGTPSPGAGHGGSDFVVFGAGATPESTLNLAWADVFLRQYPERKEQAAEACDRKLRTIPLYFLYAFGFSCFILIITGIVDAENREEWVGLLQLPGILLFFGGLTLCFKPWLDDGLIEFRRIFKKGHWSSPALRRYWGAVLLSLVMIAPVVPAYRYGRRKNPLIAHTETMHFLGWKVRVDYPRQWRRETNILFIKTQPDVTITIFCDPYLPSDPQVAQERIRVDREKAFTAVSADHTWRITPRLGPGEAGFEVDELHLSTRWLWVYLPSPKGWLYLRLSDPELKPEHEEAFRRVVASVRITRP